MLFNLDIIKLKIKFQIGQTKVENCMKPIYLVGFMGCGKTTVGNELAKKLNLRFIDLDEEIVLHTSKSIPTIFQEVKEEGFRNIETSVLKKLPIERAIISTGGGIVIRDENIEHMKESGILFYLESKIETLFNRVSNDSNRPNAINRSLEEMNELFLSRKPQYEKADFIISTTNRTPSEIALEIIHCLNISKGGDSRSKGIES